MMKSSISKPLCKFRQKCRNYKEKKQCKFSHANFTQGKGYQHNSLAQQLQQYAANTQIVKQSRFQKPKNQTQCKFGMKCNKRANNKCPFKHSESPINAEGNKAEQCAIQNKADILCRFGQSCTAFPQGICLYKHQSNQTDVRLQQTSQNSQADIFQKICLDFLLNKSCDGSCQKLHQFAQTKSISRLAQFLGCQQQINQIMVMYPYHQDQEPLFLIVYHNKISFAQLLQRQPLQCTQNAGKGDLVLKKCLDMDIQFEGQSIQSVWLVKVQAKGQRTDVIACKCNNTLKMVFLNQISYIDISIDQAVLSVISIGSFVVILFNSGKTAAFQYDLSSNGLRFKGELFEQKLSLLKKHNSFSKEVEIVTGFSVDNNLCFINKQLSLYKMKLSEQASTTQLLVDIVFFEIPTCLYALVLTSLGKIYAVNLLCFQTQIFLETNLSISDIKFSCLAISNGHLFIGIQTLGVLVYNMQKQKQLSGIIAIDCVKWKIDCGQSGTLLLLSENQSGRRDITIFKVAKLEND